MTFTGHPDWLPTSSRQSERIVVAGAPNIAAHGSWTELVTGINLGDVLQVQTGNLTLATIDFFDIIGTSLTHRRFAAGTGGASPTALLAVDTPVNTNASVTMFNNSAGGVIGYYVITSWQNTQMIRVNPSSARVVGTGATVAAGGNGDVCYPSSAGMYDRLVGVIVADQVWTAAIRWADLDAVTPLQALATWDEPIAGAGAGVPGFFDVPVRAPVATIRLANAGGVAANVKVSARLVRTNG